MDSDAKTATAPSPLDDLKNTILAFLEKNDHKKMTTFFSEFGTEEGGRPTAKEVCSILNERDTTDEWNLSPFLRVCVSQDFQMTSLLVGFLQKHDGIEDALNAAPPPVRGTTPLIGAASCGRLDTVRLLIDSGANPNLASSNEGTALSVASHYGYAAVVSLLIANGANVEQGLKSGATPLYCACTEGGGHNDVVKVLLSKGSDVDRHTDRWWRPIAAACYYGHKEVVSTLLKYNADVTPFHGICPIEQATEQGHEGCAAAIRVHLAREEKTKAEEAAAETAARDLLAELDVEEELKAGKKSKGAKKKEKRQQQQQDKQRDRDAASDAAAASQASRLKALKEANAEAEQRIKERQALVADELREKEERQKKESQHSVGGDLVPPALPSAFAKQAAVSPSAASALPPPAPDAPVDEFIASLTVSDLQLDGEIAASSSAAASARPVKDSGPSETPSRTKSFRADASDDMRCPISLALMRDPVFCADGHSYERKSIEEWLKRSSLSPATGLELEHKGLVSNVFARKIIEAYRISLAGEANRN